VDWIESETPVSSLPTDPACPPDLVVHPLGAVPAARPARLTVGIIGAGKVGTVLGIALGRAGHNLVAACALSDASRRRAEEHLPQARIADALDVAGSCSLLVLAVPDDALAPLVAGLASHVTPGTIVAHTSGANGIEVLAPMTAMGGLPLALHPAMTFAGDTGVDLARLEGAPFGITSDPAVRAVAEALVLEMGGEPVWVPEEARPIYHAGLAHGACHLVTLVCQALDALRSAGVEEPARLAGPLLRAAVDNALRRGDVATTGPVVRGDAGTVAAHLSVLAEQQPETVASYVALAQDTLRRAVDGGRLRDSDAVREVLR
jgi:predicted short-subunit dehydrogenase-like oxidoreductase (DUF2520 family)